MISKQVAAMAWEKPATMFAPKANKLLAPADHSDHGSDTAMDDLDMVHDDEYNEYGFEAVVDLPEESIVDTESSLSDGLGLGDKESEG